jgi:hypothetical protein
MAEGNQVAFASVDVDIFGGYKVGFGVARGDEEGDE